MFLLLLETPLLWLPLFGVRIPFTKFIWAYISSLLTASLSWSAIFGPFKKKNTRVRIKNEPHYYERTIYAIIFDFFNTSRSIRRRINKLSSELRRWCGAAAFILSREHLTPRCHRTFAICHITTIRYCILQQSTFLCPRIKSNIYFSCSFVFVMASASTQIRIRYVYEWHEAPTIYNE